MVDLDYKRTFVYVIGPDIGHQKIGIAKNPKKRLSQYRTHNIQNVKIHFLQSVPAFKARKIEKRAHQLLEAVHDHGEWFRVTPTKAEEAVISAMKEYKQPRSKQIDPFTWVNIGNYNGERLVWGTIDNFSLESFVEWVDVPEDEYLGDPLLVQHRSLIEPKLPKKAFRHVWMLEWIIGQFEAIVTNDCYRTACELEERVFEEYLA